MAFISSLSSTLNKHEAHDYAECIRERLPRRLQDLREQTPSLPDADPRSDRPRCGGRESNFLAAPQAKITQNSPNYKKRVELRTKTSTQTVLLQNIGAGR